MERIERFEGRRLFGADPAGYDRSRPDYPDWIFDSLAAAGALYGNFSAIQRLEPSHRARILEALVDIAEREFAGLVTRNITTCLYRLRRPIRSG